MLYLIKSEECYKIGYTRDNNTLRKRLKSYNTHNPNYKLIGIIEGTKDDEKHFHSLYNDYKVENRCEWFYLDDNYDLEDELIESFSSANYLSSLIGLKAYPSDKILNEIYNDITICINGKNINMILSDGVYIYSDKLYEIKGIKNLQTFLYNYDIYGEKYNGFIINNAIIYNYSKKGNYILPLGYISSTDSKLFDKIKDYISDYN